MAFNPNLTTSPAAAGGVFASFNGPTNPHGPGTPRCPPMLHRYRNVRLDSITMGRTTVYRQWKQCRKCGLLDAQVIGVELAPDNGPIVGGSE